MMPRQKVAPGADNASTKVMKSLTSQVLCVSVHTPRTYIFCQH